MPGHKTHAILGFVVGAIIIGIAWYFNLINPAFTWWQWAFLVPIIYLYSLMPDIDSDASIVNKIWNSAAAIFGIYAIYTGNFRILGIVAVLSILLLEWVKHRGVCHEEWFGAILAVPLWFVHPIYPFVALSAFLSHVWVDGDAFK